jgi:hypothetical protein
MTRANTSIGAAGRWIGLALLLCVAPVLGGVALDTIPAPERPLDDGLPLVGPEDAQALVVGTPAGEVVLLTLEDFQLRAGRSIDGGATLDDETVIAGGPGQPAVQMIAADLGADGTIHVALVVVYPLGEFSLQYVTGYNVGATWDPPVDLVRGSTTEDEVLAESLSLDVAAGPDDRVAVGFYKGGTFDNAESHPHVITSSDGGTGWTTEVRVDPAVEGSRDDFYRTIDVGIDQAGTVHVTYPRFGIVWYARSTDGGASFEAERDFQLGLLPVLEVAADGGVLVAFWNGLQSGELSVFRSAEILSSSSGTVLLAAVEVTGTLRVHRSTDHGAGFGSPVEISTTVSTEPTGRQARFGPTVSLARTPAGNWVLAWEDLRDAEVRSNADIHVTVSTDDGVTWLPAGRADGGVAGDSGNLVAGILAVGTDDALVVYQDTTAENGRAWNVHANRLTADPFALGGDRRVDQDAAALNVDTGPDPNVVTDGASHVYAAWRSYATGPLTDIYFTASADGGYTFDSPRRISTFPAGSRAGTQPRLAATADGYVYLVYFADDLPSWTRQIRFNRSTDFGATWLAGDVILGETAISFVPEEADIAAEPGGKVYVAWSSERNVFVSRSADGGATFATEELDQDPGPVGLSKDPRICSFGDQLVLVFRGFGEAFPPLVIWGRVSQDAGVSWSDRVALNSGLIDGPGEVACGAENKAVALWRAWNIFLYASHFDGTTWLPELSVPTPLVVVEQPAVVFASSQEVVVVYDVFDLGPDESAVYANRSGDAGVNFGAAVRLDDASPLPSAWSSSSHAAADGQGNVWVNWSDYASGTASVAVRHSADGGQTWGPVRRMDTYIPQGTRVNFTGGSPMPSAALPGTGFFVWTGQRESFRSRPLFNAWDVDDLDRDGAGEEDNCPLLPNPDQADNDGDAQGDVCDEDDDNDGLADDDDACVFSDVTPTVVIDGCDSGTPNLLVDDGCTFSDDIAEAAAGATNHGGFVSSVARLMNAAKKAGLISGAQKGAVVNCAAIAARGERP